MGSCASSATPTPPRTSPPRESRKKSSLDNLSLLREVQEILQQQGQGGEPRSAPSSFVLSKGTASSSAVPASTRYDTEVEPVTDRNLDEMVPAQHGSGAGRGAVVAARRRTCVFADSRMRFREAVRGAVVCVDLVGSVVLVGCGDYEAFVLDATEGGFEEGYELRGPHARGVSCVRLSPDAKLALTGSADHKMRLFDLCNRGKLVSIFDLEARVTAVQFSWDGRTMMAADGVRTLACWNMQESARSFKYVDKSNDAAAAQGKTVLITPNAPFGRFLVIGSEQTVKLTALDTAKHIGKSSMLATLMSPPVCIASAGVALSPTGDSKELRGVSVLVKSGELVMIPGNRSAIPPLHVRAVRGCGAVTMVACLLSTAERDCLVVHAYSHPSADLLWSTSLPLDVGGRLATVTFSPQGDRVCVGSGSHCSVFELFRAEKEAVVWAFTGRGRVVGDVQRRTLGMLVPVAW